MPEKKIDDLLASLSSKMRQADADQIASDDLVALPQWRENVRGIPNAMARSALFRAAGKGEERRLVKDEKIFALAGISIHFTGIELSQEDGDVFLQIVHMARGKPSSAEIETSGYELLQGLDWGTSSRDYDRLKASIRRLQAANIRISTKTKNWKLEYGGAILANYLFSEELDPEMMLDPVAPGKSVWKLILDSKIANLFARDVYTQIDWEQRLDLPPLAKWLHAFYHTHANPYTYRVETLYRLCGSQAAELRTFRQKLKQAMDKLQECGFLQSWSYDKDGDTITVLRA